MFRDAPSMEGRRPPSALGLGALLALLLAWGTAAWADPVRAPRAASSSGAKGGQAPVVGDVIDITGVRERPRGDTRIPWAAPEGFAKTPETTAGHTLRDEVVRPVDRESLRRLMEVERLLN